MSRIRLIHAPDRLGSYDPNDPKRTPDGEVRYHITFDDGTVEWKYQRQFEVLDEAPDPFKDIKLGNYGDVKHLKKSLIHARLSGNLANYIYSMETSNTDFYPYQYKPVLRILESPGKGLLIADEVGLGKTIEAGLIWTELRARYNFSRLVVLCPARLREKWRLELLSRFGVKAKIVDADEAFDTFERALTQRDFALIGSYEGWRTHKELVELLEAQSSSEPIIDFLIADEIHYARNESTATAQLASVIRQTAEYAAFLSATPIMLGSEELATLLKMLDPGMYSAPGLVDSIIEWNKPLVEIREEILGDKEISYENIRQKIGKYRNLHNNLSHHQVGKLDEYISRLIKTGTPVDKKIRAHIGEQLDYCNLFSVSINRTRRRDVSEIQRIRSPVDQDIVLTDKEQRFYYRVLNVIREYHARYVNNAGGFITSMPQRQLASSIPATILHWLNQAGVADDEDAGTELYEDMGNMEQGGNFAAHFGPILQAVYNHFNVDELRELRSSLTSDDSKFAKLHWELQQFLLDNPEEKIVLFSYFKATLNYLHKRLSEFGISCLLMHGNTGISVQETTTRFRNNSSVRILLTSEIGSEGIDLQFCRILINYDLPWNPMKIEQRVGRLDRIGQQSPTITIWNFIIKGTVDEKIYNQIIKRLTTFTSALGGVEWFIGTTIRDMTNKLMNPRLTPEQENELIDRAAQALETKLIQQEELEKEAGHLVSIGNVILQKIRNAREMHRWVTNKDVFEYFSGIKDLEQYGTVQCRQIEGPEIKALVRLNNTAFHQFNDYLQHNHLGTYPTRFRGEISEVECIFDNNVGAASRLGIETINQFHPIIKFVTEKYRNSVNLYKLVAAILPRNTVTDSLSALANGIYVFLVRSNYIKTEYSLKNLTYQAIEIVTEKMLDSEQAEVLISACISGGKTWHHDAGRVVDGDRAEELAFKLLSSAETKEEELMSLYKGRHLDRLEAQMQTITERHKSKSEHLNNEIRKATEERKQGWQGRVERFRKEIVKNDEYKEREIGRIEHLRSKFAFETADICLGVIKLEG